MNFSALLSNNAAYIYSLDVSVTANPPSKAPSPSMPRTNSTPGNFEGSIDQPMRLAEIHVAAEHALRQTISNSDLWNSFSSIEEFEVL